MSIFQSLREKSTPKIRKAVALAAAGITAFFGLILLFIPFCNILTAKYIFGSSTEKAVESLRPITTLTKIEHPEVLEAAELTRVVLLISLLAYLFVVGIWLLRTAMGFQREEERIVNAAKKIAIVNTVFVALYWLASTFLPAVIFGDYAERTATVLPLVLTLLVDLAFAAYLGLTQEEKPTKKDMEPKVLSSKEKQLKGKTWELFAYTSVLVVCALLAFLTKIISVEFINDSSENFSMSGIDLLKNYVALDAGAQTLTFVIFLALSVVLSFYFLALLALLSKSKAFFRFALGSILASCIGCFVIGMYGKYYQIMQAVNLEMIASWLEYKYAQLNIGTINLDGVQAEFIKSYKITSTAFYFFLLSLAVAGVILVRRPYSKGLALAKELDPDATVLSAKIENAEISLENVEGMEKRDERIPAPVLSAPNTTEMPIAFDPCPAFSELDGMEEELRFALENKTQSAVFENPTLPKLVQFIVQYARDSRLHLFYTAEDIATFIAGLGTTKLSILQGMSGTGKTSLPKIFSEALFSECEIVEVESSWRDKNELLGYYNEFSKTYTPKKFTQALYKARLNPDTITFIVLDEMNLSRIEYYFSDFLSLMENEPDKREIKLLNVGLFRSDGEEKRAYKGLSKGHTLKILPNVWFIGTANRDESTFEISDKVYDRAHTMNFNKRAKKVSCYNEELPRQFLSASKFNELLAEAKKTVDFNVEGYPVIAEVEKLLAPYNISFGNRIAMQIESFVAIYCACFTPTQEVIHDAVERILLSKVVSKLELKSVTDKEELAAAFEDLGLPRCGAFVSKLNED